MAEKKEENKEEKKEERKQEHKPEAQEVKATPVVSQTDGPERAASSGQRRGTDRAEVEKTRGEKFVSPDVDIHEGDDSLVLVADVPGVGTGGVEVKLENNVLELTAHRSEAKPAEDADYTEYAAVSYYRAFSLSQDIDAERITAGLKDGVLTVTLPKSARAKPRKIEVKAG